MKYAFTSNTVAGHTFCKFGALEVMTCHTSGVTFIAQSYGAEGMDYLRAEVTRSSVGATIEDDEGGLSFVKIAPHLLAEFLEGALHAFNKGEASVITEEVGFIDTMPRNAFVFDFYQSSTLYDAGQPYKIIASGKKPRTKVGVPHAIDPRPVLAMVLNNAPFVVDLLSFKASCLPRKTSKDEKDYRRAEDFLERTRKAVSDASACFLTLNDKE